ncbi:MAG TPA: type II secretion system protein [Gemmatimonadaceae bacterium]
MRGVTLIEMLVVLALLGIMVGVSTLALARRPPPSPALTEVQQARIGAIKSGEPRAAHGVLFLPDGRAIGPGVDPLTGAVSAR